MDACNNDLLADRAEFSLCLARAFLAPQGLSTAHLDPERAQDPFAGWQAMVPPKPKR